MGRTKQTPRGGSKSHRPKGMATATFPGGTSTEPEEQFWDTPGKGTEDSLDWPKFSDTAAHEEGEASTSKSKGEKDNPTKQAKGGADAPPKEIPPAPEPTPEDPKPGTSMDPTDAPTQAPTQDPSQPALQNPDEDNLPDLTDYVKAYKQAGKVWLDTVIDQKEQANITLFNKLQQLGDPHIDNFTDANREQVFKCIRDKTGRFLSEDDFVTYIEKEDIGKPSQYRFTGEAKEALKDYYDAVHTLSQAQANFASSTQVLEKKITDKSVFLDIIRQTQIPAVQVSVRMVEELEKLEGKTYRELTLLCHLPNFGGFSTTQLSRRE